MDRFFGDVPASGGRGSRTRLGWWGGGALFTPWALKKKPVYLAWGFRGPNHTPPLHPEREMSLKKTARVGKNDGHHRFDISDMSI